MEDKDILFKGLKEAHPLIAKLREALSGKDKQVIEKAVDLKELQKTCSWGCQLIKIDEELNEQLDIIPAKFQVIRYIKYKYTCKRCGETIKAKDPKFFIPKSITCAGLLAHVSVSKFKDRLPLYRQENIFKRIGLPEIRYYFG